MFKGKAEVRQDDETVEVKKGKAVVASDAHFKVEKFDAKEAKDTDELYQWSNLRSKYLADASAATAQGVSLQPSLWAGSGWYWNPWMGTYSWLPSGSAFSPFGYSFYSPWSYSAPMYMTPRYRLQPRMRVPIGRPGNDAACPRRAQRPPLNGPVRLGKKDLQKDFCEFSRRIALTPVSG